MDSETSPRALGGDRVDRPGCDALDPAAAVVDDASLVAVLEVASRDAAQPRGTGLHDRWPHPVRRSWVRRAAGSGSRRPSPPRWCGARASPAAASASCRPAARRKWPRWLVAKGNPHPSDVYRSGTAMKSTQWERLRVPAVVDRLDGPLVSRPLRAHPGLLRAVLPGRRGDRMDTHRRSRGARRPARHGHPRRSGLTPSS
jgi:hypothetical protein